MQRTILFFASASLSAPSQSNRSTTVGLLLPHPWCRGRQPIQPHVLISAPAWRRTLTTAAEPDSAATLMARLPTVSGASLSAPAWRSCSGVFFIPYFAAAWRGRRPASAKDSLSAPCCNSTRNASTRPLPAACTTRLNIGTTSD
jgi:hypothetical protein